MTTLSDMICTSECFFESREFRFDDVRRRHIERLESFQTIAGDTNDKGLVRADAALLHELLHISAAFDGKLHTGRRHSTLSKAKFEALLRPLVRRYLADADTALLSGLAHDGEMVARQWLERPAGRTSRQPYTEKHLFIGPVQMITRRQLHS